MLEIKWNYLHFQLFCEAHTCLFSSCKQVTSVVKFILNITILQEDFFCLMLLWMFSGLKNDSMVQESDIYHGSKIKMIFVKMNS